MKNEACISDRSLAQAASVSRRPRVSIGMPVYNGEKYLAESLDSLLAQSFADFELIISDNASTDATPDICLRYAEQDRRIKYYRNIENRGAAWNFNHVFELAKGEYFMWAAHDDLWNKEFLNKCVSALDDYPKAILCYSGMEVITENRDRVVKNFTVNKELASPRAHKRFTGGWHFPPQIPVFGLIRRDVLGKTRLIGNYSASDQVLVSELALLGRFHGLPECLFFYRRHNEQSTASPYPTMRSRMAWFDPRNSVRLTFPHWRLLREHLAAIWGGGSTATARERLLCCVSLVRWMLRRRRFLFNDLILRDLRETRNEESGADKILKN